MSLFVDYFGTTLQDISNARGQARELEKLLGERLPRVGRLRYFQVVSLTHIGSPLATHCTCELRTSRAPVQRNSSLP